MRTITSSSPRPEPHQLEELFELFGTRGPRTRLALTVEGIAEVAVSDQLTDELLDRHWTAAVTYILEGDEAALGKFESVKLGGHELVSKPEELASCINWVSDA